MPSGSLFPIAVSCFGSSLVGIGATLFKKGMNVWACERRRALFFMFLAAFLSLSGSVLFMYALSRGKASIIGLAGLITYPVQMITAVLYLNEKLVPAESIGAGLIFLGISVVALNGGA